MSEANTIHDDALPLTIQSLAEQFAACGLAAGQTVVVHTAMSKLGWIVGGAVSVIEALLQVLTPTGTLMMPAHTSGNTDPSGWQHPPVPQAWWQIIRDHMPAYDPAVTPTRQMGAVAELFRTLPGVQRSAHPISSFAAYGAHAAYLTADHHVTDEFGLTSPLGRLYELDGYVLLIGVGHSNNSSLHVAEWRAHFPSKRTIRQGTAMRVNGERQWVEFDELDLNSDDFDQIGDAYEVENGIRRGSIGRAEIRFMRQRPLVDYAVTWMGQHRR
ncbi:MAG: AAC(3) family N-acetyltransferase [Anaerolinea sp.]|nr:AAC(3) family N-acetyltransferase [Anaerolinea sp.]